MTATKSLVSSIARRRPRGEDHRRPLGGALSASGRTLPAIEACTPSDVFRGLRGASASGLQRERPRQKVASHPGEPWGYVLARFPRLSETFILREMLELEQQGHRLGVYALREVRNEPRHPRLGRLKAPVWFAPWWAWRPHLSQLRRRPGTYIRTLGAVIAGNWRDPNLLAGAVLYWGKAVAMAERAEREGIGHLHAHYATHAALAAYIVHRLTGIPFSFTVHAHDLYCHRAMLGEKMQRASAVVTISRFNQAMLEAEQRSQPGAAAASPVIVIRCGIDTGAYGALARARRLRPASPPRPLRLLAVGSLQSYKGHRYLIEACALLRGRLALECRIGGGGRLAARLEHQIAAAQLQRGPTRVQLLGALTETGVRAALAWADVFVLPSVVDPQTGQMEGVPVAVMEAMASGLAVVASRLSGLPELLEDGSTGLLVAPADAAALAEALWRLRHGEWRRQLGEAARQRVKIEFELSPNVRRLAQLLAGSRPAPAVTTAKPPEERAGMAPPASGSGARPIARIEV